MPSLRLQEAWKLQCRSKSTALGIRQPGVQIPAQQLASAVISVKFTWCTFDACWAHNRWACFSCMTSHLSGPGIQKYRNIEKLQKHSLKILRENYSEQCAIALSKGSVVSANSGLESNIRVKPVIGNFALIIFNSVHKANNCVETLHLLLKLQVDRHERITS